MAHLPPHMATSVPAPGSPSLSNRHPPSTLTNDTVVFSHTKAPTRQSGVVAGTASPIASPATLARGEDSQQQLKKLRNDNVQRMKVCIMKHGDTLGFGVRHDRYKRLQVSTLQGRDSQLKVGDTLLSVNGVDLTGQEFLTVIQQLKATRPGELVFEIERVTAPRDTGATTTTSQPSSANPWSSATVPPAATLGAATVPLAATLGPATSSSQALWSQNEANRGGQSTGRTIAGFPSTAATPSTIPVTSRPSVNGTKQPKKRSRLSQRAVTMLDDNGQPVNVTSLLADLKKERAEKATLEEKNAGLRKRLQRMLIENDEVRVQAKKEIVVAREKAKREVAEAQKQVAATRAEIRLQDRAPDIGRIESVSDELTGFKAQVERLKKAEADRTELLTTRYRGECRIAALDAQRVLDSVVGMFRTKLRHIGRMNRDGTGKPGLEVACDGVRRLAFMKLFRLVHGFAFYSSAAYHSQAPVHHTLEQEQFLDLFGNSLFHEERAGVYYVATAPMLVVFDPNAESLVLKCEWAEQNALRELARNFRF